jgi:uncharacterized membrane protein YbjE (DUF340 family)
LALDPFLYVAFAVGYILGRLTRWRSPWIARTTLGTVFALILFLGARLAPSAVETLLVTIPFAFGLIALVLGITLLIVRILPHRAPGLGGSAKPSPWLGALFGGTLVGGFAIGHVLFLPYGSLLAGALYLLLALVGFEVRLTREALRTVATPLVAAIMGAVIAAVIFSWFTSFDLRLTLGSTLGFGWYTLAGPLVATRLGAAAGLFAFLTNFLRENVTMALAPSLGPRVGSEALTAMGGATAMDTTLYFVTNYSDREAGSLALASGLVLTVLASLLIPLVLTVPIP